MSDDNAVLVERASNPECHETSAMFNRTTMGGRILGGSKGDGFVSCSLMRKRPPKIKIPNVLGEISADISVGRSMPRQGDLAVCFADSRVAVISIQGKKTFMEDAYKVFYSPNGKQVFFGVYDGHGGSKAVEFVADNLHVNIFDMLQKSRENDAKEEFVRQGYLKTDKEFLEQGGYVVMHHGAWRVHGSLAVSRSIGDANLKDWVIADPDTQVIHLTPDTEFLVLASDGLWQEVIKFKCETAVADFS